MIDLNKLRSFLDNLGQKEESLREYRRVTRIGSNSKNPWIKKSAHIGGWLFPTEHEFLWEMAIATKDGDILEVGSWMGKSTCIMAGACLDKSPGTRVICVDPFDARGTENEERYYRNLLKGEGTFYQFLNNARKLGFYRAVVPIASTVSQLPASLDLKFRMAFVDGAHDYKNVRIDAEFAVRRLLKGGLIAFHDAKMSPYSPGVEEYIRKRIFTDKRLKFYGDQGTIVAFRKI